MHPGPAGGPVIGDAFGLALLDHLDNGAEARQHFVERDDGYLESFDTAIYFTGSSLLTETESSVAGRAGRRVLDVGAGAGRHSLPLQESGREVVALDISPGATEVCRRRGVRRTFTGTVFELVEAGMNSFDTILLLGNNLGLLESPEHAPDFFAALSELAVPGGEVIGTCRDPFDTDDPLHLGYHELNRRRGRLPGQLRLRSRWANVAIPWFDYLFIPVAELEALAHDAGWDLVSHQPGPGPYLAVLRRR
jgi:SAM-dependent methyltransferase